MRITPLQFSVEVILSDLRTSSPCWVNSAFHPSMVDKKVPDNTRSRKLGNGRWGLLPSLRVCRSRPSCIIQQNLTVQGAQIVSWWISTCKFASVDPRTMMHLVYHLNLEPTIALTIGPSSFHQFQIHLGNLVTVILILCQ